MLYGYLNSPFVSNPFSDAAIPPSSLTSPVISGSGVVGQTLSTTNGTWSGALPITYSYQWNRNGSVILGATFNTYTLVTADASNSITCTVTATNAGGFASSTSNAISVAAAGDADANAFIAAAAITDTTQKSAIDKLVVDLKGYGIWTKMKAIYPFIGGTAAQHKFNLRNPLDSDAAFRLVFSGGWVHSSNGITGNGTNTVADTKLNSLLNMNVNSKHLSAYLGDNMFHCAISALNSGGGVYDQLLYVNGSYSTNLSSGAESTSAAVSKNGLHTATRTSANLKKHFISSNLQSTTTTLATGNPSMNYLIGAWFNTGFTSTNNFRMASIGNGLTDTEAANYYTAVQTFQTTLGRQVGVPIVADSDAQAFLNAAVITDQTQANAVNTLVTDLKGYGIWTKMKAIYPFVGGVASSHKYNLRNPLDTDAAFRLVFNGGWTHSSTGALPNGTNAWADTFLNPSISLTQNSTHLSYYSRTNALSTAQLEMGVYPLPSGIGASSFGISSNAAPVGHFRNRVSTSTPSTGYIPTNTLGLFVSNRDISTQQKVYRNGTLQENANINSDGIANLKISIGAVRFDLITISDYTAKQTAFNSIGDGLTDTEAVNFSVAVNNFQVTLSRNV